MFRYPRNLIESAIACRAKGLTYPEIQKKLGRRIPKGTLSHWLRGVTPPASYARKIRQLNLDALNLGRRRAVVSNRRRRRFYLDGVRDRNRGLLKLLKRLGVAKLVLAAFYLAEGAKKNRGSLTFANSDPGIIACFLRLLRKVYPVEESKFRCTVLCRADQNTEQLNLFWSRVTRVPFGQYYGARVDARTRGKVTENKDYKGVFRIDHFSSKIYDELKIIGNLMIQGPMVQR